MCNLNNSFWVGCTTHKILMGIPVNEAIDHCGEFDIFDYNDYKIIVTETLKAHPLFNLLSCEEKPYEVSNNILEVVLSCSDSIVLYDISDSTTVACSEGIPAEIYNVIKDIDRRLLSCGVKKCYEDHAFESFSCCDSGLIIRYLIPLKEFDNPVTERFVKSHFTKELADKINSVVKHLTSTYKDISINDFYYMQLDDELFDSIEIGLHYSGDIDKWGKAYTAVYNVDQLKENFPDPVVKFVLALDKEMIRMGFDKWNGFAFHAVSAYTVGNFNISYMLYE